MYRKKHINIIIETNAGYVALAESWADNVSTDLRIVHQEELTFENGYIPTGLYEDLVDVNDSNWDINHGIRDNISGFTRSAMFGALNSSAISVMTYRNQLQGSLPAGNTLADYFNIFAYYNH